MQLLVLGAGALGSLIGARLSRTPAAVSLLSTDRSHMQAIRDRGLLIEELDGSLKQYSLPAFDAHSGPTEKADIVLVTVKSYATSTAVASIKPLCHRSTVFLTLQNGIGNWERIAESAGRDAVLAGSTAQGATLLEPGRIRHGGNGPTYIGEVEGPPSERVHRIVSLFNDAGLETQPSDRMEDLIWEKLIVNAGINAITALTGIRNGFIAESPEGREVCRAAVEEAVQVARARGRSLRPDMVDRVLEVCRATAVNRSSMGQDVDRRKRTEIQSINGAIVRFAQEAGIVAPVNRTLTQLVQLMEDSYSKT